MSRRRPTRSCRQSSTRRAKGIVVVVSAGNFGINRKTGLPGYAGIASPGNAPSALTAGAARTFNTVTRVDDRVAPYSSRGPSWYDGFAKPDFVAPGDNLLSVAAAGSALRLAQEQRGNTGNYMRLSGTSMAAGVTSGVVALVLHANRDLTPNTVKAVLEYTSIPVLDDDGSRFDALVAGRRPDRSRRRRSRWRAPSIRRRLSDRPGSRRSLTPSTIDRQPVLRLVAVDYLGRPPRGGRDAAERAAAGVGPQHRLGRRPRRRRRQHRLGQPLRR